MSELEPGIEESPASTEEPVEAVAPEVPEKPEGPGIDPPDKPEPPGKPPRPPMVEMINLRPVGRVFGYKDRPTEPGETYLVSETKAKKMEKYSGQRRKPLPPQAGPKDEVV